MNTDGLNVNSVEKEITEAETVKCSSCGANMVFDPEGNVLLCNHCGNTETIKQRGNAVELDLHKGLTTEKQWDDDGVAVFKCDNCGAEIVLTKGQTATKCPFCATAHVAKVQTLAGIKPNGVVPFCLSLQKAVELSKAWAKRRLYAPRKFKKNLSTENVSGVYVPCFTFDSYTTSSYNGKIGITRTRREGSGKNARTITYTEWRFISGTSYLNFDDILVSAGGKVDQHKLNKISPFNTNVAKEYDEEYMLGFSAYHYDKDIEDCWREAKTTMDGAIRRNILSGYVYDKVAYLNVSTVHQNASFKYEMIPVYVGNFSYSKKLYNFYVNGETGKVWGKTPKSWLKILITVLISVGMVVLAVWLYLNYT